MSEGASVMPSGPSQGQPQPHPTLRWSPPHRRENVEQPEFDLMGAESDEELRVIITKGLRESLPFSERGRIR